MLESRDAWRQPGLIPPAATEGVRRIFYGDLGKNSIQTSAESQNNLRQDLRDATVCGVTILFPPVGRRLAQVVRARMQEGPVILLEGPRSVGKSTLLREVAESHGALVTDLDDPATAASVRADPTLFASGPPPVCLDEYQKAPLILDAIKARLNHPSTPGTFLLAGSTRFDALPEVAQSLTGRLHRIPVMPFTQTEIDGTNNRVLELAFAGEVRHRTQPSETPREQYIDRVTTGGFPLALAQPSAAARSRWFADHVRLTLERDARETRGFANAAALRTLLTRLAGQSAQMLNINRVAVGLGVSANTTASYIKLLEVVFLVTTLPAWGLTVGSRAVNSPKIHVLDSGVGAHLLRLTPARIARRDPAVLTEFGHLLESFVSQEVIRQASWLDDPTTTGHWRTLDDEDVDLIVERDDGTVVAVEVKAGDHVEGRELNAMAKLRKRLGSSFAAGLVFHLGSRGYVADDRIHVLPVDRLWT